MLPRLNAFILPPFLESGVWQNLLLDLLPQHALGSLSTMFLVLSHERDGRCDTGSLPSVAGGHRDAQKALKHEPDPKEYSIWRSIVTRPSTADPLFSGTTSGPGLIGSRA